MSTFEQYAAVAARHNEALHGDDCTLTPRSGAAAVTLKADIVESDAPIDGADAPGVADPFGNAVGLYARCSIRKTQNIGGVDVAISRPQYMDKITDPAGTVWTVQSVKSLPAWWDVVLVTDQRAGLKTRGA